MDAWTWRCVALLLISCALAEEIPQDSFTTSAPSTPRPEHVGIRGYRRFHANDSLIGQSIQCSHEEKLCFQYNLLYNGDYGGCYRPGYAFFGGDINRGYLYESERRKTHLKGVKSADFCRGYRMAFDDICYQKEVVRDYICGCDAEPSPHFLHGVECRCTPPKPIVVNQPEEEGECRIPDLRFPENDRFHYFQNASKDLQGFKVEGFTVQISDPLPQFACFREQAQCFSKGDVWLSEVNGCFPLLQRGPCAEDHVVALDARAGWNGRAEGTCMHVRGGCPEDHVRMAFDGQCHHENDVKIAVTGDLFRDQFGLFVVVPRGFSQINYGLKFKPIKTFMKLNDIDICAVNIIKSPHPPATYRPPIKPFCGQNDQSQCARYEATAIIPNPELLLE